MMIRYKKYIYIFLIYIFHFIFKLCFFNNARILLLKIVGAQIGSNNFFSRHVTFDFPWRLRIANNNYFNKDVYLDCRGGYIHIGSNNDFSLNCKIFTLSHKTDSIYFDIKKGDVVICDSCWICVNAILLPNSVLNSGTIIGANVSFAYESEKFTKYLNNIRETKLKINEIKKLRDG